MTDALAALQQAREASIGKSGATLGRQDRSAVTARAADASRMGGGD